MLEPLHACNLSCAGCGRIREYADTMHRRLSVDQCLAAVAERGVPIVSVRGEPLIYPEIETLVECLVQAAEARLSLHQRRVAGQKAPRLSPQQPALHQCASRRHGGHARWDGRARGRFAAAVRGILDAKTAGFQVCTNTTVYRDTDMHEVAVLFDYLYELGVDGFMISPAFGYESAAAFNLQAAERIFMTRQEVTRNSHGPRRSYNDSGLRPRRSTWNFSAASANWTVPLGRIPPTTSAAGEAPAICSATPITKPTASWLTRPTGANWSLG